MIGFLGVALLWGIAAFQIDIANEGILSARMEEIFGRNMLLLTILLGGLLGGMGALTGTLGQRLFK